MKKIYIIGLAILSLLILSLFFIRLEKIEEDIIKEVQEPIIVQEQENKIEKAQQILEEKYGFGGMDLKEFGLDNEKTENLEYESSNFDFRTSYKNIFNGVKQDIYITNKDNIDKKINFSTSIGIDYSKVRWNGKEYELTETPVKFDSWYEKDAAGYDKLAVPNIFMDDVYNKRINYRDIAEKGGYALAYEKSGKYYIELKIDNLFIKAGEEYYIDPVYSNGTGGFSTSSLLGSNDERGITGNTTDLWIVERDDKFIYHVGESRTNLSDGCSINALDVAINGVARNETGGSFWLVATVYMSHVDSSCANQTDGFSLLTGGNGNSNALDMDINDTDFWVADYNDNFIYHYDYGGTNQSGGISLTALTGIDFAYGVAMNESDFWVLGANDYVYHIDENGNNMTDGFSIADAGSTFSEGMFYNDSDLYFIDYVDHFVYQFNATLPAGSATPIVTLNYPGNATNTTIWTQDFNCSAVVSGYNITNISFAHNISGTWEINQTATRGLYSEDSYEFNLNFTKNQSMLWNCYICNNNTPTDCAYGTNNTFNLKNFIVNAENYSQSAVEGSSQTFYINISNSNREISSAALIYNGTSYNGSYSSNNYNHTISRTITVPSVTTPTNYSFYWTFTFNDTSTYTSDTHNQSVSPTALDACDTYTNRIFNITVRDEETTALLAGSTENTSVKIDFNITTATGLEVVTYSNFSNATNPTLVCSENSLTGSSLRLDGIIEYSSLGRFTEFYHFQNYSLGDDVVDINLSMYNLNSSDGQEFKITYKDDNFVPVEGALMDIQRKYIDEGVYRTTERPKTGAEGYTIGHLVVNDIVYNILIYKDGVLLASFLDIVADCQNPLLSSCTINLNSYGSSVMPENFQTTNDISFTLTYDKETREVESVYSIISGATTPVSLDVTLFDTLGNTTVCNDTLTAAGGTLNCIVPDSFGNATIVSRVSKDSRIVGQSIVSIKQDPSDLYGSSLMFCSLVLFLSLVGLGISDNPMITGVSILIGFITLVLLNLVTTGAIIGPGASILYVVVAMIIILVKGSSRQ